MLELIIIICTLTISIFFLHKSNIFFTKISIQSVLLILILIFNYIGFIFIALNPAEYYLDDGGESSELTLELLAIISLATACLSMGFFIGYKLIGLPSYPNNFNKRKYYYKLYSVKLLYFIITSICIMVGFLYLSNFGFDQIAIFNFEKSPIELMKIRSDMGNSFTGKYHWYEAFMRGGLSLMLYASFAVFLETKINFYKLLFITTFIFGIFIFSISGEKSPAAWLMIGVFITYVVINNAGVINKKIIYYFSIVLIVAVSIITILAISTLSEGADISHVLIYRLFLGYLQAGYYHLSLIPSIIPFQYGATISNPGSIFPYTPFSLSTEIAAIVSPDLQKNGVVGSFPTMYWGEAYANFGIYGVVTISTLLGIYLQLIVKLVGKMQSGAVKVAIFVWIIMHYSSLAFSGLSWILFDVKFMVVIIISYIIYNHERNFRNCKNKYIEKKI